MDIIIYHKNCLDGWVAYTTWIDHHDKDPDYDWYAYPSTYDKPVEIKVREGARIVILDFSVPKEQLEEWIEQELEVVWIDHHISAIKRIGHVDGVKGIQRTDRSGAWLTWEWLNPDGDEPPFITQVADTYDRFVQPNGLLHEIAVYITQFVGSFLWWHEKVVNTSTLELTENAAIVGDYRRSIFDGIIEKGFTAYMPGFDGQVFVISAPAALVSDLSYYILSKNTHNVVLNVTPTEYGFNYSIRSRQGEVDVSEIAAAFGGGGHQPAAGFSSKNLVYWT